MNADASSRQLLRAAIIAAAALCAAALATWAGLPAPALIGATALFTILTLSGRNIRMPNWLRDTAFTIIGVALGASVTPSFFSDIVHYPATIGALVVTMAIVMVVTGAILMRLEGLDRPTAMLATSPGALSVTLALAMEREGATPPVMTLQTLRLVLITLVLPPLISMTGKAAYPVHMQGDALTFPAEAALLTLGGLLGFVLARRRMPAPFLISGLLVSGAAHYLGVVEGPQPASVTFVGLAIAGATIGSRFTGIQRRTLARLVFTGTFLTGLAMVITGGCAWLVAQATGFPFPQIWIAYAPGGAEGMAAMAISLGHDPAFVATHHVFRIFALIVILPFLVRRT